MVGAVDQILQRLLAGDGFLGDASSPVAAEIPVGSSDARNIAAENYSDVVAGDAVGAVTDGFNVVEADAAPRAVHGGQRRPRDLLASFLVERVAFGERDYGRILTRRTQSALLHHRFRVAGRQIGKVSNFHWTLGRVDIAHR